MHIQNNGRVKLACLAMEFAKKEVRNPKLTKQGLDQIVDTILAALWTPDAVRAVGSDVINHFLQDLRATSLSTVTYATVRDTLVDPIRKNAPLAGNLEPVGGIDPEI